MIRFSYIVLDRLSSFPSNDDFRRVLAFVKECGYDGIELNLTEPAGVDLERLPEWLRELDLVVPSFLTGEAYRDGLCLSTSDSEVRRRTVERLVGYVETAQRFGAILVIGLLQGLRSDEPDTELANRRIAECLREVAAVAEEKQVDCVLEPVNHLQVGFNNTVGEVREMVARVGSPALRPMVDTVHMNIEEQSLVQPIRDCGAMLRHVHLCESNGALFGTGHIDFAEVLGALSEIGYNGFASVKVYRGAPWQEAARSSLEYLRKLRPTQPG